MDGRAGCAILHPAQVTLDLFDLAAQPSEFAFDGQDVADRVGLVQDLLIARHRHVQVFQLQLGVAVLLADVVRVHLARAQLSQPLDGRHQLVRSRRGDADKEAPVAVVRFVHHVFDEHTAMLANDGAKLGGGAGDVVDHDVERCLDVQHFALGVGRGRRLRRSRTTEGHGSGRS